MMRSSVTMQPGRIGPRGLLGEWASPPRAQGLVVVVHGGAWHVGDPRRRDKAGVLHRHGLATLQFDLRSDEEGADGVDLDPRHRTRRVLEALAWLADEPACADRPIGLFAEFDAAHIALHVAAERPARVAAVVLCSGRWDGATDALARVQAPTLLIVGALDDEVLGTHREALRRLSGPKRLEVVPAARDFEEPGALDGMAHLAGDWFARHLVGVAPLAA